jgi:hypothetical protein
VRDREEQRYSVLLAAVLAGSETVRRARVRPLPTAVAAFALVALSGSDAVHTGAAEASSPRALCEVRTEPPRSGGSVRGLVHELPQYPNLASATATERAAARRLLTRARHAARAWRDSRAAARAGFAADRPSRRPGDRSIGIFHAEHRRFSGDRHFLDPARPEVLIYANVPGRPLVLIGVMFSVPRGVLGPSPGGPVTRWHSHMVCARGAARGLAPRADGTCPPGARLRRGSEMLHLWFTPDLRSAYAIKVPEPAFCAAGVLPARHCASGTRLRTM